MKTSLKKTLLLALAGVGSLLFVWGIAYFAVGNEYVLPSPWDTAVAAGKLLCEGSFYTAFFATLGRAALAFLMALILGGGFALASYLYPTFSHILRPIVAVLRALPTMAVLLIILLGTSYSFAPVIIGVLTLFPMIYTATLTALCGVDKKLIEACRVYKLPVKKQVAGLYLPMALPAIVRESVAALSFSLKLTVSAEVLAFTYRSLGGMMQEAALSVEVATLAALTVVVCLVGLLIELVGGVCMACWEKKRCG